MAQAYRNRFVTGEGSIDLAAWEKMVKDGFAYKQGPIDMYGGAFLFQLTEDAARLVLNKTEKLDPEDFR